MFTQPSVVELSPSRAEIDRVLLRRLHGFRKVAPAALVALALLVCGACSGSTAVPPSPSATVDSGSSDPCAPPPPPQQPALHLCLSGGLSGNALVPSRETTSCTGQLPGSFSATFVTLVNSIETRLELTDDSGPGTFQLDDPASNVTVTVVQGGQKSWSSIGSTPSGSISFAPDRSGSLDVTLAQRDLDSGASVPGAAALTVRGTFRCPQ
jgi:hypothetical protein